MHEYGVSFKYIRYLQEYGSLHFTLYALQCFTFDEKSWVHMHYLAKRQNPILRAVSPVFQNLYVEYLIRINILWARKYASFEHSAYCRNLYGRFSHLRAKYGKSPQFFCKFSLRGNTNLCWRTTRLDLWNDMHFIWVYCFGSMLMTSCFMGVTPTVGRKKIT